MAYRRSALMERRLSENRERIVAATRDLVSVGGFRGAQIAAVAARAGISTGAIYRYFPSKAELFMEVLTDAVKHEIKLLRVIVAEQQPAAVRLRAAVESFVRRALAGPHLAYAFIAEPVDPLVDSARIRYRRAFGEVFKAVLRDGVRSGEFAEQNLDVSAACIVGAFTEALVGPVAPSARRVQDKERLVGEICDFCLRAVERNARPAAGTARNSARSRAAKLVS